MQYAHQCALFFHDLGFNVFPCYDGRDPVWKSWADPKRESPLHLKHPMWRFTQARLSKEDLTRYFPRTELFALETGKYQGKLSEWQGKYIVGIDCDNKHGNNGVGELKAAFGIDDTTTFSVETATGGGRHYYFLSDTPVHNRAGMLPGVDVRGHHGFLYMPGSTFLGKDGEILRYRALSGNMRTIQRIPDALLQMVLAGPPPKEEHAAGPHRHIGNLFTWKRTVSSEAIAKHPRLWEMVQVLNGEVYFEDMRNMIFNNLCLVDDIEEGNRNNALYTVAQFLNALSPRYLAPEEVYDFLFQISPLPDEEKQTTLASAEASRRAADKFYDYKCDYELFREHYDRHKHRVQEEKQGVDTAPGM